MLTERPSQKLHSKGPAGGRGRLGLALACSVLALVAGATAAVAWSRPATASQEVSYTQSGRLSYTAAVPPGSVYGAAGLKTGEPAYGDVVKAVQFSFSYQLRTALPATVSGTESIVASIDNGQGITRSVVVQRPAHFHGSSFSASGALALSALRAIVGSFERAAGTSAYASYNVTVAPTVSLGGSLGGTRLTTTFAPRFSFSWAGGSLVPAGGSTGAGGTGQGMTQPFSSTSTSSLAAARAEPARFPFTAFKVTTVRVVSLGVLALALVAGALAGKRPFEEAISKDEAVRIAARHSRSLVEADSIPDHPAVVAVEVASFEGLAEIARRLESPVLHTAGARYGEDTYAVIDNGTLYRYRPGGAAPAPAPSLQARSRVRQAPVLGRTAG